MGGGYVCGVGNERTNAFLYSLFTGPAPLTCDSPTAEGIAIHYRTFIHD